MAPVHDVFKLLDRAIEAARQGSRDVESKLQAAITQFLQVEGVALLNYYHLAWDRNFDYVIERLPDYVRGKYRKQIEEHVELQRMILREHIEELRRREKRII